MEGRLDAIREALLSPIPWVVLSAVIALTATAWFVVERGRHDEARQRFERGTEIATVAVRTRMLAYEQVLRAGAARMASDDEVTRADWRRFIARLQLEQRFPGIKSVGYAEQLTEATLPAHVRRVRAEGFSEYKVAPPADRGDPAVVVLYVVSLAGTQPVVMGEDLHADPLRRAAIDKALRSGLPAITGPLELGGAGGTGPAPGFLMFVPVARTEESRHDLAMAASGYVFGALRMREVLQGVLDQKVLQMVEMRVYDQADAQATRIELIDTGIASRAAMPQSQPLFSRVVDFPMPGRSWTIHYVSRPELDAALRGQRPWAVLVGGSLASVVMFLLSTALVEAWNRAHHLSMRDPLTGLYNRRYLDETIPREVARAKRAGQCVGVIVLDIDHFKRLNDSHGHDMGDVVLRRVGDLLHTATRAGDIACRMGGEEFAVILPGATPEATRYRAESIRGAFHAMRFDCDGHEIGPFTLSAGISSLSPASLDWAQALREADRALYAAKEAGRNRVLDASEVADSTRRPSGGHQAATL